MVMENYDPSSRQRTRPGDIVVGRLQLRHRLQSREQAVTALQAEGHPARDRRQLLADLPAQRVQQRLPLHRVPRPARGACSELLRPRDRARERTIIPGDELEIDFTHRHDRLARRDVPLPGARQRAAVAGRGGRRREPGAASSWLACRACQRDARSRQDRMAQRYRRDDARRRHRQGGPPRGAAGARGGRASRPTTSTATSAGTSGARRATPLPDRTDRAARRSTSSACSAPSPRKPKDEADAELAPGAAGQGPTSTSARSSRCGSSSTSTSASAPASSFPGNPLNFIRRTPSGGFEEPKVDAVIFRQNTEGLYSRRRVDQPARRTCARRSRPTRRCKPFANVPGEDLAVSLPHLHARRLPPHRRAPPSSYAKKYGYKSVTVCEKPNVIRETSGHDGGRGEEDRRRTTRTSQLWSTNIDAQMMWLTKNPEDYGVIVAGNMFGDIISDGFAGLVGGLGLRLLAATSAARCGLRADPRLGAQVREARPVDRQPDRHDPLGGDDARPRRRDRRRPSAIRDAIAAVVAEGKVRTYDMMRLHRRPRGLPAGRGHHAADDRRDHREAVARRRRRDRREPWRHRAATARCPGRRRRAGRAPTSARTCHVALEPARAAADRARRRVQGRVVYGEAIRGAACATRARGRSACGTRARRGRGPGRAARSSSRPGSRRRLRRAGVAGRRSRARRARRPAPRRRRATGCAARASTSRATSPKFMLNAGLHGPDGVILDLEDSVHAGGEGRGAPARAQRPARARLRRRASAWCASTRAARAGGPRRDRARRRPTWS